MPAPRNDDRRFLRLFGLYGALIHAEFMSGIYVLYLQDRGFSYSEVCLLQSVFYWTNLLTELPAGVFADIKGRRPSLLVAISLVIIFTVGCISLEGLLPFIALFVVRGVAWAFFSGSGTALLYDNLRAFGRDHDYARLNGWITAISFGSLSACTALGGVLRDFSWNHVYVAYAVCATFALVCMYAIKEEPLPKEGEDDAPLGFWRSLKVFGSGRHATAVYIFIVANALFLATINIGFVFMQALLRVDGMSTRGAASVMGLAELCGAIGFFISYRVRRRVGTAAGLCVLFAAPACFTISVGYSSIAVQVGGYLMLMLWGSVGEIMADAHLQDTIPSKIRTSLTSVVAVLTSAISGLGFAVSGGAGVSVRTLVIALTALPVLACVVALVHFRMLRATRTHAETA